MKVNLGLVGLGEVHQHHAAALRRCEGIEARLGFDVDSTRQSPLDTIQHCGSLDELAIDVSIDAVIISTSTGSHYEVAAKVLNEGKHVLLEKPATTRLDDLISLRQLSNEQGVQLITAFHDAFGPEVTTYARFVHPTVVEREGPPVEIKSTYRDPYYSEESLSDHAVGLMGAWLDSGSNALSVIHRIVSGLDVTSARIERDPETGVIVLADVEYTSAKTQAAVHLTMDWTQPEKKKTTEIFFEGGKSYLLDHSRRRITEREGESESLLFEDSNPTYRLVQQYVKVFDHMKNCIATRTDNYTYSLAVHRSLFAPRWTDTGGRDTEAT